MSKEKCKTNEKSENEKLRELKEMLLGYWIHRTISEDEWRKYERRNVWW